MLLSGVIKYKCWKVLMTLKILTSIQTAKFEEKCKQNVKNIIFGEMH